MLVSVLVSPIVDRLHLPFAALAFSAVVSLMPGFFLFNAATGLVELVSIGPSAPVALLTSIVANGTTAFLIVMAMTFGLILPRLLFERLCPRQHESGMDVLCTAPPFKISPKPRHIRYDRAAGPGDRR